MLSVRNEIKSKEEFLGLYNKYIQNIKLINNSIDGGFKHQLHSRTIIFILPIKEKNIILILFEKFELRIYKLDNINDSNYYLSKILNIFDGNDKIGIESIELYNIDNKIILIIDKHFNHLSLIEIVYDKSNKPIDINFLDKEKYKEISELNKNFYSFDLIDEDKIIFTDQNNNAYIFQKNKENQFFLYKTFDIVKSYHDSKNENQILCDKYNNNIIIYYQIYNNNDNCICFNIYDFNYNPKKIINNKDKTDNKFHETLQILNKDCYIYFYRKTILIISSKYLEIVSVYKINDINKYIRSIVVLNNANRILLFYYDVLVIYKFYQNELIYVGKKSMNNNSIIDIKEINDKGDHIIAINTTLDLEIGQKEISRLSYVKNINNENDSSIKKDYSSFKIKSFDSFGHFWEWFNNGFGPDYPINEFHCYGCYLHYLDLYFDLYFDNVDQKFIYRDKKEDRYYLKKKYNNKKKRRYINFRILKNKKQYRKYKSNKRNLNKYENQDYEDIYYYDSENYFY